jgi:regulator of replication initiation timing
MKKFAIITIFLTFSIVGISQSKKELQQQISVLISEKQKLSDEKLKLMEDVLNLKQQILDIKTENLTYKSEIDQLRTQLTSNSNASSNPSNSAISTQNTSKSQANGRCQAITAKGTQCSRTAESGSNYCWQHRGTYEPASTAGSDSNKSSVSPSKSSGTTTSGRTIMTGPRGGQYYINKNGNKTYIKK